MRREFHLYEDQLRELVEDQKLQQWKVAEMMGRDRETIRRWCKRLGIRTQSVGPRRGEGHPEWKGGRRLVGRYWYIYCPDHPRATKSRYVLEHRLLMEKKLGRFLEEKEVVHHIDGDPQNNALDNLMVFSSNGEHLREELSWSEKHSAAIRRGIEKRRLGKEHDADPHSQSTGHLLE